MSKFTTCLWFNGDAAEAASLYTDIFEEGVLKDRSNYVDDEHMPKGSVMTVMFKLGDQAFFGLNGGPDFTFTPAISFFVDCETEEQMQHLWDNLGKNGKVLMPVEEYPFSKKFGWIEDRFGVSWQLNLTGIKQQISPALMFCNDVFGKAEEAMNHWMTIFGNGKVETIQKNEDDSVSQSIFTVQGQTFRVMDSDYKHDFGFSMATSFCFDCKDQEEIDRVWAAVTENGKEWPCGWMEDQYGVCWQIANRNMGKFLDNSDPERANRVMQALYKMKKIDLSLLQKAYDNE